MQLLPGWSDEMGLLRVGWATIKILSTPIRCMHQQTDGRRVACGGHDARSLVSARPEMRPCSLASVSCRCIVVGPYIMS
jgi:hypothetical protein